MKPMDIRAAISRAGTSQIAIAQYLDLSPTTVSQVVNGKSRSARVEAELAKIIGKPPFGPPARKGPQKKSAWTGQVLRAAA
ncbi:MAG: helix-turn-helix domain-containing protein [Burkholderiaceae bacterium]|nr:helix-turn-helix domain-containing protein [Burkholderiaceae bacterium]